MRYPLQSGKTLSKRPGVDFMSEAASSANRSRIFGFDLKYLLDEWKEALNPNSIPADIWAGLTVALVALPLNLALAIAAGVEPGVGITTGIVAGFIGSLFGGQKYAITGPAAAMAVVLIELAQNYGLPAIWLVGITAGLMQVAAGTFRLGKLISFIPRPVIVGFANAIGVLVIFNSLDDLLGVHSNKITHLGMPPPLMGHPLIPEFIQDVGSLFWNVIVNQQWNIFAIVTGSLVVALAVLVPRWTRVIPGQLVAIVVASMLASSLHFDIPRIIDIASIPRSLPMPHPIYLPWENLDTLFASAVTVFMLGSIESLLSASVADGMTMSRKHHSDQELIGQGIANLISPFFGGIPVTGVIARTAINIRAGARTRLSGVVHAISLLIMSIVLAKFAEQIPLAALGGILVLTGARLIESAATREIWHASRTEGAITLITTAVSVLFDLTAGVVTGLILTCGLFIKQMSAVRIVAHDYDPDRRASVRLPVPTCKFVRTFLVDGPLFFGAAERFTETILLTQNLKVIILQMRAVDHIDLTGASTILSIHAQLKRNGVRLVLAELPNKPFELLRRTGAVEKIGRTNFFRDFREAILSVNESLLSSTCRSCCAVLNDDDPGSKKTGGPEGCVLRNAMLINTEQIANVMRQRLISPTVPPNGEDKVEAPESEELDPRLIALETKESIAEKFAGGPIEQLVICQNLYEVHEDFTDDKADLVIGMCVDYRKQLHLPKNCAYIIRAPGGNMLDQEFSIALALSAGIKHMALIVHNKCLMSDPFSKKEGLVNILRNEQGWTDEEAVAYFDHFASERAINDPVRFAQEEAKRLRALFTGLMIVPLHYNVDNDKLYLIQE